MKSRFLFISLILFCLATSFTSSADPKIQRRMLLELEFIKNIFEIKYAPLDWKKNYASFDLDKTFDAARKRITEKTSTKQYQQILRDVFNATCDYHVGVSFYSTESATLPFLIKGVEGRYFITYIDRGQLPRSRFPFQVGDELVSFDDKPIEDVLEKLRKEEFGCGNTLITDQALAEFTLTNRLGSRGHTVPCGDVALTFLQKRTGRAHRKVLSWDYNAEQIHTYPTTSSVSTSTATFSDWQKNPIKCLKESDILNKLMVYSQWQRSYVGGSLDLDNRHYIGSRRSYIPTLGEKIWETSRDDFFDAYVFIAPSGTRVGYIRIASYLADEEESKEYCHWIDYMQKHTDALIIDQINNPGGSVFYLYSLLAALTDKPLETPKHRITLTQEEIYLAVSSLPYLDDITTEEEARDFFGETLGGYPVSLENIELLKQFYRFLIQQWNEGKTLTDPIFLFGVDKIMPHPQVRYTKPILLLTNSLDFSGGDFFPAILQDNHRATILGERTAGAGGFVLGTSYFNQNGIREFHLTGSLAERINNEPIENLGVKPDIAYSLTVNDLQNNYEDYVETILNTVESILP